MSDEPLTGEFLASLVKQHWLQGAPPLVTEKEILPAWQHLSLPEGPSHSHIGSSSRTDERGDVHAIYHFSPDDIIHHSHIVVGHLSVLTHKIADMLSHYGMKQVDKPFTTEEIRVKIDAGIDPVTASAHFICSFWLVV